MLPIDSLLPQIVASLRRAPNLVIEAAPGAGKTTRVPPALLEFEGDVVVLEPRRIAARMAARRVGAGYQVRFEKSGAPGTRLWFVTEGVLTRRLLSDPQLRGVGTVVLDEFHERHLDTDLALALLRRLQKTTRPELRIVVMSATLDAGPVARFLGECPVLKSKGRLFELSVEHLPYSALPLETQIAQAAESVPSGDTLVFLPGAAEIRKAMRACEPMARRLNLLLAPLYGDLSPAEQDRAVEASAQRKIIFSTNIAESSITIEGVRTVIDSGLARIATDSPWTGLPALEVQRISQASARQRAGRAGRTGPGRVIRLYTAEDFHRRAEHDSPEIQRRELLQMCLHLELACVRDLEWLDPPPAASLDAAEQLLDRLQARGRDAAAMARMPLHPRLARLVLAAGDAGCRAAALLSSGQRVRSNDLFHALEEEWDSRTKMVYDQIRRVAERVPGGDLASAALLAFPDRVGRRRANGVVLFANGTSGKIAEGQEGFLVALDVDGSLARLACAIEPEWLLDYFPERVRERNTAEWNRQSGRVEAVNALLYDELIIEETRGGPVDAALAGKMLTARLVEKEFDRSELDALLNRLDFAGMAVSEQVVSEAIETLCYGLSSLAEAERALPGLPALVEQTIDSRLLERVAPARLKLAGGRSVKINYERGKPPWVASRLQDFFGMTESPRIGREKTALVLHLLAPNQRPVQMTTDLAGFWERLYPQLRKELGRRYPRHSWPENPV